MISELQNALEQRAVPDTSRQLRKKSPQASGWFGSKSEAKVRPFPTCCFLEKEREDNDAVLMPRLGVPTFNSAFLSAGREKSCLCGREGAKGSGVGLVPLGEV